MSKQSGACMPFVPCHRVRVQENTACMVAVSKDVNKWIKHSYDSVMTSAATCCLLLPRAEE